jgi:hypothetical protein
MSEQQELITRFGASQNDLLDAVSGLDERQAGEVWSGTWAVNDILAHISGWEWALSEALTKIAKGERPMVEGIDLNDTDGTNAIFAQQAAGSAFAELLVQLRSAGDGVAVAIQAIPDDRLEEGRTARRIAETLIHHPGEHAAEIRSWRGSRAC